MGGAHDSSNPGDAVARPGARRAGPRSAELVRRNVLASDARAAGYVKRSERLELMTSTARPHELAAEILAVTTYTRPEAELHAHALMRDAELLGVDPVEHASDVMLSLLD